MTFEGEPVTGVVDAQTGAISIPALALNSDGNLVAAIAIFNIDLLATL
jgi:hypothetical protein